MVRWSSRQHLPPRRIMRFGWMQCPWTPATARHAVDVVLGELVQSSYRNPVNDGPLLLACHSICDADPRAARQRAPPTCAATDRHERLARGIMTTWRYGPHLHEPIAHDVDDKLPAGPPGNGTQSGRQGLLLRIPRQSRHDGCLTAKPETPSSLPNRCPVCMWTKVTARLCSIRVQLWPRHCCEPSSLTTRVLSTSSSRRVVPPFRRCNDEAVCQCCMS